MFKPLADGWLGDWLRTAAGRQRLGASALRLKLSVLVMCQGRGDLVATAL